MKTNIEKLPKSAIKLTVTIPAEEVKKTYNVTLEEVAKNAELPGFRKGTAPKEMVREKTDVSKLYGEVVNELLEKFYPQAIKEALITPVSNPKVEITSFGGASASGLKEFDLEKDFEFVATVATRPSIKVGDYKTKLKKDYEEKLSTAKKKQAEKLAKGEELKELHVHLSTNDIINAVIETSEVEVADILVEEEADRLLTKLVDQAQAIGLSLDQYLKSQNKTAEQLRADYTKMAEHNLKAEFLLSEMVKEEKIEVTDEEIEEMYTAAGEPDAKAKLQDSMQKWYIKSILEKNKLISKIMEEIEGENHHDHNHQ